MLLSLKSKPQMPGTAFLGRPTLCQHASQLTILLDILQRPWVELEKQPVAGVGCCQGRTLSALSPIDPQSKGWSLPFWLYNRSSLAPSVNSLSDDGLIQVYSQVAHG